MVSVEKGVFIKPLSLMTLFFLVFISLAPQTVATAVATLFEWSILSTVVTLGFFAYFVNPFRKQVEIEVQSPLRSPRTLNLEFEIQLSISSHEFIFWDVFRRWEWVQEFHPWDRFPLEIQIPSRFIRSVPIPIYELNSLRLCFVHHIHD